MLNVSDILFDSSIPLSTKTEILTYLDRYNHLSDLPVLKPTASNDDVNGSQHASNGGTDFTYQDATIEDVRDASTLGYYEYFANYSFDTYTGHYYQGDDRKFDALVIDPPAYAADHTI